MRLEYIPGMGAFRPFRLEVPMNFVRRIESNRKVSKNPFMVYWRHYG